MSLSFYLSAHWGARAASVDECAQRLAALMEQLARVDPLLTGWREGANSLRAAIKQPLVTTEHTDLVTRLLAGRSREYFNDRPVIEELGYSVGWWNGNPDAHTRLSVACGITSSAVSNSCSLDLPEPDEGPHLYDPAIAATLLNIVIDTWHTDRVVWTNHDVVDRQCQPDRRLEGGGIEGGQLIGHPAGWANYLSDSDPVKFDIGLLPAGATVQRLGTGTLVLVGHDPANPPLDDVLQVRRAMGYEVPPPHKRLI
jgi:hypothetical protein